MCGRLTHVVRRLNKNAYKGKATYRRVPFPQREEVILLIMKKVDESKRGCVKMQINNLTTFNL